MIQHGKGADMGAAFGSGAAGTVFGAEGGGSFLTRTTAILAAVFFVNCLLIASPLIRNSDSATGSIADAIEQQEADAANAATGALQPGSLEEAARQSGMAITEGDLPDAPAVPATDAGKSDLPE